MIVKHRRLILFVLSLALLVIVGGGYRLTRCPEWTVLTGDEKERQEICRSIYRQSARRATWSVGRLLDDQSPVVRVAAIEALARRPDLHADLGAKVQELANLDRPHVRARAIEFVFQQTGTISPPLRRQAFADLQDAEFRRLHPALLAAYLSVELDHASTNAVAWSLGILENIPAEDGAGFRSLLRYPEYLQPFRDRLRYDLGHASVPQRSLLLAALTAIGDAPNGSPGADQGHAGGPRGPSVSLSFEAEAVHSLQPNFLRDIQQGECCLYLGEGAGGEHFWRNTAHSSVDIGKGFFTFVLGKADTYQFWARGWFPDKCGNNSLYHIDDRRLTLRPHGDKHDVLQAWHWVRIADDVFLAGGSHVLTITAADDGPLYDRFAVLPMAEVFDSNHPPPLSPLFNSSLPSSISITLDRQAQSRGTTQGARVWVRRNTAQIAGGVVSLAVPAPFQLDGPEAVEVKFAPAQPLATAEFRISLPMDALGGEVKAEACFTVDNRELAADSVVLGINHDWYTTGPLDLHDSRSLALKSRTSVRMDEVAEGWTPYPEKGYDRFRRLDFEQAYGHMDNKVIFLQTEIEVLRDGEYLSLLNIDDLGYVFIDGRKTCGRAEEGVGEGWLLMDKVHLAAGRHSVFAWVQQAAGADPSGPRAGRYSPNNWVFKWLLREDLHVPTRYIRSVPLHKQHRPPPKRPSEAGSRISAPDRV